MARLNDTEAIAKKPLKEGCLDIRAALESRGTCNPNAGEACVADSIEHRLKSAKPNCGPGSESLKGARMYLDRGEL